MSNDTYRTAYKGLRLQAKTHGVDPNTFAMNSFLKHTAEVMTQDREQIIEYERIINNPVRRK